MIDEEHRPQYWHQTVRLMALLMVATGAACLLVPLLTGFLNRFIVLTFPLGFYMAAQGAIFLGMIAAFWYATRQESIDRRSGAMEDM
jgi:putative solute:sodium symporter small subunit